MIRKDTESKKRTFSLSTMYGRNKVYQEHFVLSLSFTLFFGNI